MVFIVGSFNTLHAQEKQKLTKILEKLQLKYDCNFSYIDKDLKNVYSPFPDSNFTLTESVEFLQKNTSLVFTMLANKFITITKFAPDSYTICGYLYDSSTNQGIGGAVVQTKNNAAITDDKGYFTLDKVTDNLIVTFRHIGYSIFTDYAKNYTNKDCEVIYLDAKTESLSEVVLSNYLTNGINKIIDGTININYRNFGQIPGLIETDVLQTIQSLSGFQSIDETVSNINVRGGTHDQNLILWDGIKMYQSGHFFGLISALNPRITKRVTLIKNGSAASYTDGVSGTIDMSTENKLNKVLKAEAGINFINADVFLDIPVTKNSSVQLASRKSINEWLNTPTYEQYFDRAFQNTDVVNSTISTNSTDETFDFYDVSLRWLYELSKRDKIKLNLLHLNNNLSIAENAFGGGLTATRESSLDQKNSAGGLNYEREWSDQIESSIQFGISNFELDAINFDIIEEQILTQKNEIQEFGIDLNNSYHFSEQFTFKAGYHFKSTTITNIDKVNFPVVDILEKEKVEVHGISTEANFKSEDLNTHINLGTRLNYINPFEQIFIEPRLSINHRLNDRFTVELLGEFKHQTTTLLSSNENFLGIDSRRWYLSNDVDVPIIKSKQLSFGANYKFRGLMINSEFYYKNVKGITSASQGFRNQFENIQSEGQYDVIGLDFIINQTFDQLNTWLSYSLANNRYEFESLQEGYFPSNYNIRHAISLAGSYDLDQLKISSGINWRSGRPTTPLANNGQVNSINYGEPNSENLPAYVRFDASAIYNFSMGDKLKAEAGVSVLNILNKKNVINQYYALDEDGQAQIINQYSLGITPNVAFRVFF